MSKNHEIEDNQNSYSELTFRDIYFKLITIIAFFISLSYLIYNLELHFPSCSCDDFILKNSRFLTREMKETGVRNIYKANYDFYICYSNIMKNSENISIYMDKTRLSECIFYDDNPSFCNENIRSDCLSPIGPIAVSFVASVFFCLILFIVENKQTRLFCQAITTILSSVAAIHFIYNM